MLDLLAVAIATDAFTPIRYNCMTREVWSPPKTLWCRQLLHTEWQHGAATLQFINDTHVAGSGGCNRFIAPLSIKKGLKTSELDITFGAIASTLRACPPALSNAETTFLNALSNAQRLRLDGNTLFIDIKGQGQPLKLTRIKGKEDSANRKSPKN